MRLRWPSLIYSLFYLLLSNLDTVLQIRGIGPMVSHRFGERPNGCYRGFTERRSCPFPAIRGAIINNILIRGNVLSMSNKMDRRYLYPESTTHHRLRQQLKTRGGGTSRLRCNAAPASPTLRDTSRCSENRPACRSAERCRLRVPPCRRRRRDATRRRATAANRH